MSQVDSLCLSTLQLILCFYPVYLKKMLQHVSSVLIVHHISAHGSKGTTFFSDFIQYLLLPTLSFNMPHK